MNAQALAELGWLPPLTDNFQARLQEVRSSAEAHGWVALARHRLSDNQCASLGKGFSKWRTAAATPGLDPVRLLVLSNSTCTHLVDFLIAAGLRHGLSVVVETVSYLAADHPAVDAARIRRFDPHYALLAFDAQAFVGSSELGRPAAESDVIADNLARWRLRSASLREVCGAVQLVQTIPETPSTGLGHLAGQASGSTRRILAALNHAFFEAAEAGTHHILDIAQLAATVGLANWLEPRLYNVGLYPFALKWAPLYAEHVCRKLAALRGRSRRVLVLDLDNTLWSGVVGDDGVDRLEMGEGTAAGRAHRELQRAVLRLRERGVLLAVASKNHRETALAPFRSAPDMLLREDSFAAFQANWDDKATNLRRISEELALGLDSFVFLDDNPVEREWVRRMLPEVAVPEVPDDPSEFAAVLEAAGYFEPASISAEDTRRAEAYRRRQEAHAVAPERMEDFLKGLDMRLQVEVASPRNRARLVQLTNKSNQFNLTTARITEAELERLEQDADACVLGFRLEDRLEDHGLISVVSMAREGTRASITRWLMSCRVIGRGVELAVLGALIHRARSWGCSTLIGQYIPTARNSMVRDHYAGLGFEKLRGDGAESTQWSLDLEHASGGSPTIRLENESAEAVGPTDQGT